MAVTGPVRSDAVNAEVLVWQNRYRKAFVSGIGAVAVALRGVGVLRPSSAIPSLGGPATHLTVGLAAVGAYVAVISLLDWRVRRSRRARLRTVAAVTSADVLLGFVVMLFITPPAYYGRALVLALFGLQFTLLYFGRVAAVASLVTIVAGYGALLTVAWAGGTRVEWPEEAWTLTIFTAGSAVLITVLGDLNHRLSRIVRMFERAEEGDFTLAYDEAADPRPDSVTFVGRAYNRMRAQLTAIALTDPLSGCLNRRGFEQQLAREVARALRAGSELALIAVDVDYFKRVNDTFGHLAGDAVIREIGELLRETVRAGDVVARPGGEEFMILAPATNIAGAYHLAVRVLEAFRARAFAGVEGRIPITASLGVVADHVLEETMVGALRSRADEALYAAKKGGRNRVAIWTERR